MFHATKLEKMHVGDVYFQVPGVELQYKACFVTMAVGKCLQHPSTLTFVWFFFENNLENS
jgi:hypothetical protein